MGMACDPDRVGFFPVIEPFEQLYTRYAIVARALGLVGARAKVSCIQFEQQISLLFIHNNSNNFLICEPAYLSG